MKNGWNLNEAFKPLSCVCLKNAIGKGIVR